ncbi:MAG: hypothetical protein JWM01_2327 [Arthrobacter sp.]|jgi:hypothetical protein|nr:hypothetical protein [Arthrobacter sp.]
MYFPCNDDPDRALALALALALKSSWQCARRCH